MMEFEDRNLIRNPGIIQAHRNVLQTFQIFNGGLKGESV